MSTRLKTIPWHMAPKYINENDAWALARCRALDVIERLRRAWHNEAPELEGWQVDMLKYESQIASACQDVLGAVDVRMRDARVAVLTDGYSTATAPTALATREDGRVCLVHAVLDGDYLRRRPVAAYLAATRGQYDVYLYDIATSRLHNVVNMHTLDVAKRIASAIRAIRHFADSFADGILPMSNAHIEREIDEIAELAVTGKPSARQHARELLMQLVRPFASYDDGNVPTIATDNHIIRFVSSRNVGSYVQVTRSRF